ncbi:unnamed protein product [Ilex paraguariensis]|uniref:Cytochrome b561 and DOMON domain-containing protein n=1 Tax=Ilex paraguariensis TaxID=185542 RepID=A0ABC8R714_9AQUA
MEECLSFKVSWLVRWALLFVVLNSLLAPNVLADEEDDDDISVFCSVDLTTLFPSPYYNLSNMYCPYDYEVKLQFFYVAKVVSFLCRCISFFEGLVYEIWLIVITEDVICKEQYSLSEDNVLTIVLSTIYTSGWVGMGFSKDGMMLNSSAMVGWVDTNGRPRIKQYYIGGFTSSEIKPDKGELPLTDVPPYATLYAASFYLAFQMKFARPLTKKQILLAFASKYPENLRLTHHDDKTTLGFDFSAGKIDSPPAINNDGHLKKTHGLLGLLGWGILLPCGAMVARHLKHRDPLWYYLHIAIQFVGFMFGLAAVVVGLSLYESMDANVPEHRGIGIFVLALSILQVLAFFLRPHKDSTFRRYWNWYHSWSGRIALFFGAVNIVLGFQIGEKGSEWKIQYGFLLGTVLLTSIILEALLILKKSEKQVPPPAFQLPQ